IRDDLVTGVQTCALPIYELYRFKLRFDAPNVRVDGFIAPEQVPAFLAAADVLVLPNKKGNTESEQYTSPLKLREYMASGTPIVRSEERRVGKKAGSGGRT